MSRIVEFTYYITPDGVVYNFDNRDDKFLMSFTGEGMPEIEYIQQNGPMQHGASIIDYRLKPRIIQYVHVRQACDRDGYWDARADLINMLRPNRQTPGYNMKLGTLRKVLPDRSRRDIDALIQRGPLFEARDLDNWNEFGYVETLQFICPDPTFYDPTVSTAIWALSAGSNLVFPFTFPFIFGSSIINQPLNVVYTGSWLAYPIITVHGPIEGVIITNESTDEEIALRYIVQSGEDVVFNLQFGNKTVTSSIYGNLIGSVEGDIATFHLAPDPEVAGGINVLNAVGLNVDSSTQISICWNTRYIGI